MAETAGTDSMPVAVAVEAPAILAIRVHPAAQALALLEALPGLVMAVAQVVEEEATVMAVARAAHAL
jgi:hypothetical protein